MIDWEKVAEAGLKERFEELSRMAYKGEEIDKYSPMCDRVAYVQLYYLYQSFKQGLDKEKCLEHKGNIQLGYARDWQEEQEIKENLREHQNKINKTETMIYGLNSSQNEREALERCLDIISVLLEDESLRERIMSKFE